VPLPDAAQAAAAGESGEPLLAAEHWPRAAQWRTELRALLRQVLQARAAGAGQITAQSSPHFTRDYVHLDDVVDALIRIAVQGQAPVYNVASGVNVSNAELFEYLKQRWGCAVQPLLDTRPAPTPRISTVRLRTELQWQPRGLLAALDSLWATGPGA